MARKIEGLTPEGASNQIRLILNKLLQALGNKIRFLDLDEIRKPILINRFNSISTDVFSEIRNENGRKRIARAIDELFSLSSDKLLTLIDINGGLYISDKTIVVGTSFMSTFASLTPGEKLLFIERHDEVAHTWRSRPFGINSSSEDLNKTINSNIRLPSTGTNSTPLTPLNGGGGFFNISDFGEINPICVTCSDASQRRYHWGHHLGLINLLNIFKLTDSVLLGQTVVPSSIKKFDFLGEESVLFEMVDRKGKKRKIICPKLIFATGPGEEKPITDSLGRNVLDEVRSQIKLNKQLIYEGRTPLKIDAPHALNLTIISELIFHWMNDLNSDSSMYPFSDLFETIYDKLPYFIGSGDSTKVLMEFVLGKWSKDAYPEDIYKRLNSPLEKQEQRTFNLVNVDFIVNGQLIDSIRSRYEQTLSEILKSINFRYCQYKKVSIRINMFGNTIIADTNSRSEFEVKGYVFSSIGFDNSPDIVESIRSKSQFVLKSVICTQLGNIIEMFGTPILPSGDDLIGKFFEDSKGVARIIFLGSAAKLQILRGGSIDRAINLLQIPENTIAQWLNALRTEIMMIYLRKKSLDKYSDLKLNNISPKINYSGIVKSLIVNIPDE